MADVAFAFDDVRQIAQAERDRRRRNSVRVLGEQSESSRRHRCRQFHFLFDRTRRIAEKRDLDLLAGLSARGNDSGRPREGAQVQPILTGTISAVSALTHLHIVGAIGRDDDRAAGILTEQRRIVGRGQLETLAIEYGEIGVEHRRPQTHGLDLGTDALTFFRLEGVVVNVLVVRSAVNGDVQRDFLRRGEVVIRLFLIDDRKGTNPESAQFTDSARGAHTSQVFAESSIRGHLQRYLELIVIDDFEFRDGDAGLIEEEFLRIAQARAIEQKDGVGPALHSAWRNAVQHRRCAEKICTTETQRTQRKNNGSHE